MSAGLTIYRQKILSCPSSEPASTTIPPKNDAIVEGIHEALIANIGMPPDEHFNLVSEQDGQSFFYSRSFNGFAQSDQVVAGRNHHAA